jgi:dipeptide/tripeptide permease
MLPSATSMTFTETNDNENYDETPHHQQQQLPKQQHQSIFRNKVILSILVTETAERVAYFGFRAVLVLYFTNGLKFSESTSVSLFASVSGLAYLSPLLGALLADSLWGRYQTIWRFGTVYSIGLCLITLGAYQLGPPLPISCPISMDMNTSDCGDISNELNHSRDIAQENLLLARSLSFVGLILVCLGTGGIKPCVSAFGADQVVLADSHATRHVSETSSSTQKYSNVDDEDEDLSDLVLEENNSTMEAPATKKELSKSTNLSSEENKQDYIREFFNSFYFCINVGALLSFALIPIVRAHFGFGAAFFIPTVFMVGALGIFISQRKVYKHRSRDSSQPSLFKTLYMCAAILFAKSDGNYRQINSSTTSSMDRDVPVSTVNHPPRVAEDEQPETSMRAKDEDTAESETDVNSTRERRDAEQILHLMPLMLFFPVFWMLYDQQGSVWTLQATRLNRYGLEPEQTGVCMCCFPLWMQLRFEFEFECNEMFREILQAGLVFFFRNCLHNII